MPEPPLTHVAYTYSPWWHVRHLSLSERVRIYRSIVAEGTFPTLREAAVAMHAKWRRDRITLAAMERQRWHAEQLRKYRRRLARLSDIVHATGAPCAYCGDPNPRTIDHVDPLLPRGGPDELANLVRCCLRCNSEKNHRTPQAWMKARIAAGLSWPPKPSEKRPAIPEGVTAARVSVAQMRVLTTLSENGPSPLGSVLPRTLSSMRRHGFIEWPSTSRPCFAITDRGRLALATGRIPR